MAFPAVAQTKSHLQPVLERGTLRVGTTGDLSPMSVKDTATNSYKALTSRRSSNYQEVLAGRALATITSNIETAILMATCPTLTTVGGAEPRNKRPFAYPAAQNDPAWRTFLNNWVAS